ncbi:MAG: hypothetical protein EOO46_12400 [Flavobacterium sp.]|nr:MAG: hypothetical protein EOO46_12400 [Flavobacterium sp.]
MKKWLIPVIVALIILGAILFYFFNKQIEPKSLTKAELLREIYKKVAKLDLPLDFAARNYSLHNNDDYHVENNDTLLFPNSTWIEGALKDTSKYFTFIKIVVADANFPVLMTFNKKGILISEEVMALGGGVDCGYTYSEKGMLKKDLTIDLYMKEESQECNDSGAFGPITIIETTRFGQITKNGKIVMKKPVKKEWILKDSTEISPTLNDSLTTNSN